MLGSSGIVLAVAPLYPSQVVQSSANHYPPCTPVYIDIGYMDGGGGPGQAGRGGGAAVPLM